MKETKKESPFPLFLCALVVTLIIGCQQNETTPLLFKAFTPTPTQNPTYSPTPSPLPSATATQTPLPTSTPTPSHTPFVPDAGWEYLHSGVERRTINIFDDAGKQRELLYILRIEPSLYQFGVSYDPQAKSLADWQKETNALIIFNGGYYRQTEAGFIPNGLTIVNGSIIGHSFGDFAGMLAINEAGPTLRWVAQNPYNPDETLSAALQSFPILIKPGGILGFPEEYEDHRRARRSIIAQDKQGRILFMVADYGYFTLHQLSLYLSQSDLDLDMAINLDGGPSSGLLLAEPFDKISAFIELPVVITVHKR